MLRFLATHACIYEEVEPGLPFSVWSCDTSFRVGGARYPFTASFRSSCSKAEAHPVDLVLADTVIGGLIAPCRDGLAHLLGYLNRPDGVQFKVFRHGQGKRQRRPTNSSDRDGSG